MSVVGSCKMASLVKQLFSRYSANNFKHLLQKSENFAATALSRFSTNVSTPITPTPYTIVDPEAETNLTKEIIKKVNDEITQNRYGRLFAVVHLAGKQFKVTEGDIIVVEGYWPPDLGDKISLDKVLVVGGKDFSLIGRPLLQQGLVQTEATVIEKTLSHTKTNFKKKRRKQYKRIHFYRIPQTMLRINKIELLGEVNNPPEVSGLEKVIL